MTNKQFEEYESAVSYYYNDSYKIEDEKKLFLLRPTTFSNKFRTRFAGLWGLTLVVCAVVIFLIATLSGDKIAAENWLVALIGILFWGTILSFFVTAIVSYIAKDSYRDFFSKSELDELLQKYKKAKKLDVNKNHESAKVLNLTWSQELRELKKLKDEGILSDKEFEIKKKQILNKDM